MKLDLTVTYDDGTTVAVHPGQREMAEWETQPFGCSSLDAFNLKPVSYFRFIAWAALKRSDGLKTPYPKWSEGVDSVQFTEGAEEPDGRPDPTNPKQREGA